MAFNNKLFVVHGTTSNASCVNHSFSYKLFVQLNELERKYYDSTSTQKNLDL